jgi:hypothetical protein
MNAFQNAYRSSSVRGDEFHLHQAVERWLKSRQVAITWWPLVETHLKLLTAAASVDLYRTTWDAFAGAVASFPDFISYLKKTYNMHDPNARPESSSGSGVQFCPSMFARFGRIGGHSGTNALEGYNKTIRHTILKSNNGILNLVRVAERLQVESQDHEAVFGDPIRKAEAQRSANARKSTPSWLRNASVPPDVAQVSPPSNKSNQSNQSDKSDKNKKSNTSTNAAVTMIALDSDSDVESIGEREPVEPTTDDSLCSVCKKNPKNRKCKLKLCIIDSARVPFRCITDHNKSTKKVSQTSQLPNQIKQATIEGAVVEFEYARGRTPFQVRQVRLVARDNVTNVPKYTTNGQPIGAHKRFGEPFFGVPMTQGASEAMTYYTWLVVPSSFRQISLPVGGLPAGGSGGACGGTGFTFDYCSSTSIDGRRCFQWTTTLDIFELDAFDRCVSCGEQQRYNCVARHVVFERQLSQC